jgi:hypothetical protein
MLIRISLPESRLQGFGIIYGRARHGPSPRSAFDALND